MAEQIVDGGGQRLDTGKAPVHLVAPSLYTAVARVMGFGATKYAPWNWSRGMAWSKPYSCCLRHLFAWWCGEDIDAESGQPHLALAAANIMMLIEYRETFQKGDDRPKGIVANPLPPESPPIQPGGN
jgi:hypothetical protein